MSDPFADLNRVTLELAGDDLTYRPGGGAPITPPFRAWVLYSDVVAALDGSSAIIGEPSVQVRVLDVAEPSDSDVITLPKTGLDYLPKSWVRTPDGDFWAIELELA